VGMARGQQQAVVLLLLVVVVVGAAAGWACHCQLGTKGTKGWLVGVGVGVGGARPSSPHPSLSKCRHGSLLGPRLKQQQRQQQR
jgi:hypothetical protein